MVVLLAAALLAGFGLIVGTCFLRTGSSISSYETGALVDGTMVARTYTTESRSITLLENEGRSVLFVVSIPGCAVLVVTAAILRRRRAQRAGAGRLAWTITGLLGGFALLGAMSIGLFVLPVVVLLIAACSAEGPSDRDPDPMSPLIRRATRLRGRRAIR